MRLPAVAIAAAFAGGAALGQANRLAQFVSLRGVLACGFMLAWLLIVAGVFASCRDQHRSASVLSLSAWSVLGLIGAGIASQPLPANHILQLLETKKIESKTPLRWRGRLRDEPARLPWGYGYEIELSGVEYQGMRVPAQGGLRINWNAPSGDESASPDMVPEVHAGDHVAVVVQAKRPQVFRDDGAFDRRAYLADHGVHLIGTLRSPELLQGESAAHWGVAVLIAGARHRLRDEADSLFAVQPQVGAVLRAMLLGDRSFVERSEATDFQKTGVFHLLVVAGLHVGALVFFLVWLGRRFKLSPLWTAVATLVLLLAYVGIVEERPPVLRAALMTAIVLLGRLFFRRLDLLNSAALAALILLVANPLAVRDSSFQLTFLAIGCIAGLALPWLDKTVQPYARALRGWRDTTRDMSHEPKAAQFRIELRSVCRWISAHSPARLGNWMADGVVGGLAFSLRAWELLVITLVLQLGMLPLMAGDFHRITLDAPAVNLLAVPLMGLIVPLGFLTLGSGLLHTGIAKFFATPLSWLVLVLLRMVGWFAHFARWSYRIPGPPVWLVVVFLVALLLLCCSVRVSTLWGGWLWRASAAMTGAGALAIVLFPFSPRWSAGRLELTVLDVGQGDSLLVISPHGKTMLVDGGGGFTGFAGHEEHGGADPGEEAVSPYLWSRGFQRLDVVALTHAHQDHIGGLAAVLENFRIGKLWIGREVASPALANLERIAVEKKIPIVREVRGAPFSFDEVETRFLWPESASGVDRAPQNNDSLVMRLQFGDLALLLPGDLEKQAEKSLLAETPEASLHAEVLKVGHHGSKNSTTPEFLAAVHPRIAIISAGEDNPYGHPNPELLSRLDTAGVRVLRTDRDGAIHVLTDGTRLEFSCFVPCANSPNASAHWLARLPQNQQHHQQQ